VVQCSVVAIAGIANHLESFLSNGLGCVFLTSWNRRPPFPDCGLSVVEVKANTYGLDFGGSAVSRRDWDFIAAVIGQYDVQSCLEFGAGLSTLLLNDRLPKVVTYEVHQFWIDKINGIKPCDIRLWDGKTYENTTAFDFAFVDGPSGDKQRRMSTKAASDQARVVIVHDANREWAREYQRMYLVSRFQVLGRGGDRCCLWVRKEEKEHF